MGNTRWALLHSTRGIQDWFAPAAHLRVVTGTCHEGVVNLIGTGTLEESADRFGPLAED